MAQRSTTQAITQALMAAGLALGATSAVFAEDQPPVLTDASTSMLATQCAGCHGTDGASAGPATPIIAGLSEDYFVDLMKEFASGEAYSTIMGRIAKGYSEDEIKQLAKHFGSKPFVAATQDFDDSQVKKGSKLHEKYCEKCHADGGSSAEDDAGVLAGQWTPYLTWTLADFRAGDRQMTRKMKKKVEQMLSEEGDAGIQALLNYYASQQ
jgi:sulfide dehydrogenase cytochrome subunit